jgi:hypothetical protein
VGKSMKRRLREVRHRPEPERVVISGCGNPTKIRGDARLVNLLVEATTQSPAGRKLDMAPYHDPIRLSARGRADCQVVRSQRRTWWSTFGSPASHRPESSGNIPNEAESGLGITVSPKGADHTWVSPDLSAMTSRSWSRTQ